MKVLACGFNAHSQLTQSTSSDLFHPIEIELADNVKIIFAGWSETTLISTRARTLCRRGAVNGQPVDLKWAPKDAALEAAFGDDNGLRGAIDTEGFLYVIETASSSIRRINNDEDSPRIGYVAVAGNGNIAVVFRNKRAAMTHIIQHKTIDAFLNWYNDPANEHNYPSKHFMVGGMTRQLVANAIGFTILMETGDVWTWGDARFPACLGRHPTKDHPEHEPGQVSSLGGLSVAKIASGGWLSMALTEAGEAYIWGMGEPGGQGSVMSANAAGELVNAVKLGKEDMDKKDVVDIAVGSGHVLLLDSDGLVWTAGKNSNGQLGIGRATKFKTEWQEMQVGKSDGKIVSLHAGPLTSFVVIESTST